MPWSGIVAKNFDHAGFARYVDGLKWTSWKPSFLVVHNTATPSLAQRPDGLTLQHIRNLETYYRDHQKWASGPHLFIDDRQIWVFAPLTGRGTHSPSWNSTAIGIEMLGDFNKESFITGRGNQVRNNTAFAIAALSLKLGFKADAWKWHTEDPKTTHDCPGINARKDRERFVADIQQYMTHGTPWGPMPSDDSKQG